jgi:hypothetical protein
LNDKLNTERIIWGLAAESIVKKTDKIKGLEKELEEEKLLVEELKEENKNLGISEKANLSAIRVAEE